MTIDNNTTKDDPLHAEQDLKITLHLRLFRYGDSDSEIEARIEDEMRIVEEVLRAINSEIEWDRYTECAITAEKMGDIRYM